MGDSFASDETRKVGQGRFLFSAVSAVDGDEKKSVHFGREAIHVFMVECRIDIIVSLVICLYVESQCQQNKRQKNGRRNQPRPPHLSLA